MIYYPPKTYFNIVCDNCEEMLDDEKSLFTDYASTIKLAKEWGWTVQNEEKEREAHKHYCDECSTNFL